MSFNIKLPPPPKKKVATFLQTLIEKLFGGPHGGKQIGPEGHLSLPGASDNNFI